MENYTQTVLNFFMGTAYEEIKKEAIALEKKNFMDFVCCMMA